MRLDFLASELNTASGLRSIAQRGCRLLAVCFALDMGRERRELGARKVGRRQGRDRVCLDPDPFIVHTTIMRSASLHARSTRKRKKQTTSSLEGVRVGDLRPSENQANGGRDERRLYSQVIFVWEVLKPECSHPLRPALLLSSPVKFVIHSPL